MEDIIFNGTENHAPLNYAEVALTFSNEDRYLPIDYKEVSVARRLYRSGESQYFINKNPVRLKDVQELFMGTGIGESTYSFVEQGKIEVFLSYKPEDKRLIFDEASGIVKYKERKKETLRRLKDTDDNLLRLEDILSEVRRQIRYLERQVEKAKKYKEVQETLVEAEKKIAHLQNSELQEKINKLIEELNVFKVQEEAQSGQLQEIDSKWQALNSQLKALRLRLQEAATNVISLQAKCESSTSRISVYNQRIKELRERNAHLDISKENLNKRLEIQEQRNHQEIERLSVIESASKSLQEILLKLEAEKQDLKIKTEEAKKATNSDKARILELEEKKAQAHNSFIQNQAKLSALINRKKRLTLDKARLDVLLSDNKSKFDAIKTQAYQAQEGLKALEDKNKFLAERIKKLQAQITENREDLNNKEKEFVELNATYEFLQELRTKYETFSVKKRITVIFDEEPGDINKIVASLQGAEFVKEGSSYKAQIEAKVISFEEKQLEQRLERVKTEIEEKTQILKALESEHLSAEEELSSERFQIEAERRNVQDKLQEKDSCSKEVVRLEEESELLDQEMNSVLGELDSFQQQQAEIQEELNVHEINLAKVQENLSFCQEIIVNGLERAKEIDIELARNQAQIQSLSNEKETLSSKITFFEDEINNIHDGLEQVDKEKEDSLRTIESLTGEISALELGIEESKEEIDKHITEKTSLEAEDSKLNEDIEGAREFIQKNEEKIQDIKNSAYNKKLEIQSLEYEKEKIKDYLKQVYEIEFDFEGGSEITETKEGLLEERERLQKRVKSLGEVNLVAIEEFEELKKRDDFLENQKQDLISAKENLKRAIQKINRTSKELFMDTFTKIEAEFKKNFKFLFNGGRANLILLDQEDILESGVEIEVQPPGKKLQNVSLLSGGEKALTAISLIFAIFTVRPSPLCVLDEIDAPLDEANVDRFNHILKKFASFSQFIVITHNKKTMSNADVLYGVTMQEKGISKLVSVKFAAESVPA
jgi:chromosome segregation protein